MFVQGFMDVTNADDELLNWASRIRDARQKANLTQKQLGAKIGRSQQTIDGYETGSREPDVAMYKAIARACNVDPIWLIFGDIAGRANPRGDETLTAILAEAHKQSRHFAWAFHQAAQFLSQEGIDADFPYVFAYTKKLLRTVESESDNARAQQAILRTIELDREELRLNLERTRNRIL